MARKPDNKPDKVPVRKPAKPRVSGTSRDVQPDDTRRPLFEPPAAWRTWSNFKLLNNQFLPARPITIIDPSGASKP